MLKGVWGNPAPSRKDRDGVARYLDRLQEVGINAVFMHLKGGDGLLYWPSKLFPQSVAEEYGDYPALLLEEGRKRGIEIHAWMIDYFDSGAPHREHPEWAMRDPQGRTTAEIELRGKPFGCIWQCPARRPGYTDQWLVPVYREFAEMYDFDGIHHDYVRYPGDVAPDTYCFCDYCLEAIPRYAGYINESYPEEPFYHELYDRPFLESHWEQNPRVLPQNWSKLDRASKARFLLDGSFFQGGRQDLDYFFYQFRVEAVARFAREAAEAVRSVRPNMQITGAIFKNPVHSGRFIGQDWRRFAGYMDIPIPMDYRDHFPGTFEQYLTLLGEAVRKQKEWSKDFKALYIGFAINFLFHEEPNGPYPGSKLERVVEVLKGENVDGLVMFCDNQIGDFGMWDAIRRSLAD